MSAEVDHSVAGDKDAWLLFDRTTPDGYPLVVLARTGNVLVEASIRDAFMTVVECEPDVALVNERGMPQHTDRIYPVEDALARELHALSVGALHVASVTGDGLRRLVFTHAQPLDFEPVLRPFEVEGYSLRGTSVDDRDEWVALVTPTDVDRLLDGDRGVISHLEDSGDDGSVPRKTDFWFYGDSAALAKLAEDLGPWGYAIDHWLDDPEGVVLTGEIPANYETFCEVTPMLVSMAERHGVTYDGWETFVVRPEQEPVEPAPQSLLSRLFGAKKN